MTTTPTLADSALATAYALAAAYADAAADATTA